MLKMIIADDEQIIRESLCSLIDWEALDIKLVSCCKNGLEAMDAILDAAPDIVMTDIAMPGLGGLELIAKMRQIDMQMEFIILSGYKEFEFATQAMEMGVKYYLLKPIGEQQIVETVKKAKADHLAKQPEPVKLPEVSQEFSGNKGRAALVERAKSHVIKNLAEPNLSLKWIAQNLLYMNVDYLSHQFVAETGENFSVFLTRVRMEKAKELLLRYDADKIYTVAEQVGCGNNPRYFSQVFRKYTGMTPSKFIAASMRPHDPENTIVR